MLPSTGSLSLRPLGFIEWSPKTHKPIRLLGPCSKTGRKYFASFLVISSSFHLLSKVLFIFPSRYLFAIGLSSVFSLGWGIPAEFGVHSQTLLLCYRHTVWLGRGGSLLTGLLPSLVLVFKPFLRFPPVFGWLVCRHTTLAPQVRPDPRRNRVPGNQISMLGSCFFARRYWSNHCYFLFLHLVICLSPVGDSI